MIKPLLFTLASLLLLTPMTRAEDDPPKELKEMIAKGEELLKKEALLDFLKHAMHPDIIEQMQKSGKTLEQIAQEMKERPKKVEVLQKVLASLAKSKCDLNADKSEATFKVDKSLFGEDAPPKPTIKFSMHEKKWYINER